MTTLLEHALDAARSLPADMQDEIARIILRLAGTDDAAAPVVLTKPELEAVAVSKAAASRGAFATDEAVRAVWSRHGL